MPTFFPNDVFGWCFVATAVAVLSVAAYTDTKRLHVPKAASLGLLALGLLMNLIRGGWLGSTGRKVWLFADTSLAVGMLDGVLFAVAGFLAGFVLFFGFWMLGVAGGGDVKIVAATGAWFGPLYLLGVLLFTFVVVVVFTVGGVVFGTAKKVKRAEDGKTVRRLMSFTLPLTVAVAAFVYIVFGPELGFRTVPVPTR